MTASATLSASSPSPSPPPGHSSLSPVSSETSTTPMHPLRHSASFPTLPSTSFLTPPPSSLLSISSTSQPPSPARVQHPSHPHVHHSHIVHTSSSTSPPSPHPFPAPAASSSILYTFPSQPLSPPPHFCRVESSIYRSSFFTPLHHPFLSSLHLKSVMIMSPDPLPSSILHYLHSHHISIHHVHTSSPQTPLHSLIKSSLEHLLHSTPHPLLLLSSPSSPPLTSLLIGCLRHLQGWCYSAIVDEYGRVGGGVEHGRRWLDEVMMEQRWEEEVYVDPNHQVRWWRETIERMRRKKEYRGRKQRQATMDERRKERRERKDRRRVQRVGVEERRKWRMGQVIAEEDERREVEYERRVLMRLSVESEGDGREEQDDDEEMRRDAVYKDVDASLDRLLFTNPHNRLVTSEVKFDKKLSIIEDDDD